VRGEKGVAEREKGGQAGTGSPTSGNEERKEGRAHAPLLVLIGDAQVNGGGEEGEGDGGEVR